MSSTAHRSRPTKASATMSETKQKRQDHTPLCKGKILLKLQQKHNSQTLQQYREGALTDRKVEKPEDYNHKLKSISPERNLKNQYNLMTRRGSCKNFNVMGKINTNSKTVSKAESPKNKEKDNKSPINGLILKRNDMARKSTPCFNNVLKEFLVTNSKPKEQEKDIKYSNIAGKDEISFNNLCSPVNKNVESFDSGFILGISLGDLSEKNTVPSTDFTKKVEALKKKLSLEKNKNKELEEKIDIINISMKKNEKSLFLNSFDCFNKKIAKLQTEFSEFKETIKKILDTEIKKQNEFMQSFKETCLNAFYQKIRELKNVIESQKTSLESLKTCEATEKYEKRIEDLNKKLGNLYKSYTENAKIAADNQKELDIVKSLYEEDKKMWEKEKKILALQNKYFECPKKQSKECEKAVVYIDYEDQVRTEVSERSVSIGDNKGNMKLDTDMKVKELERLLEVTIKERDEYRHKLVSALLS
ncbi:hypothetical protein SteCoe_23614 [Stentor coeruleus]|uniref:Uncharacterized protein n=1 Tax=Stentor coeruleus TaxID=5963 RepID=A0A1R2BJK1_9CILI|nr:hypothetical protein SteCoe_23614 [Stentor coeruleus]